MQTRSLSILRFAFAFPFWHAPPVIDDDLALSWTYLALEPRLLECLGHCVEHWGKSNRGRASWPPLQRRLAPAPLLQATDSA